MLIRGTYFSHPLLHLLSSCVSNFYGCAFTIFYICLYETSRESFVDENTKNKTNEFFSRSVKINQIFYHFTLS